MVFETWLMTLIAMLITGSSGSLGLDASVLKLFRMVRLTRMARMARLLRWIPELLILLKGLWLASKSVFFTLVLLMITIYVFALTFRQLTDGTEIGEHYFRNVPCSIASLLLEGTLPDFADMVREVGEEHIGYSFLILLFIL